MHVCVCVCAHAFACVLGIECAFPFLERAFPLRARVDTRSRIGKGVAHASIEGILDGVEIFGNLGWEDVLHRRERRQRKKNREKVSIEA